MARPLIFTRRGINIKRYPAIEEHLSQWKAELTPKRNGNEKVGRKPGPYRWYEIQDNVAYYKAFEQPKIVFPDIAKESRFTFDAEKTYFNNTTYFIPVENLYLLGVLNSEVMWNYAKENLTVVGDADQRGRLRFFRQVVRDLPVLAAPTADRDAIAGLVQKCLDVKGVDCEEWEAEIDGRVAALYGL